MTVTPIAGASQLPATQLKAAVRFGSVTLITGSRNSKPQASLARVALAFQLASPLPFSPTPHGAAP